MNEYGFKVCREIDGKYFSGTVCGRVIEYRVGFETIPHSGCGPLAVFDTYKQAMEFAERELPIGRRCLGYSMALFLCVFQPSKYDCMWPWSRGSAGCITITEQYKLPVGTVLADKVMLLHQPLYRITLENLI